MSRRTRVFFKDLGNNVVQITDVPAPGMAFPVFTSSDMAAKIWALDAAGAKLGDLTTEDGNLDFSKFAGKVVKIHVEGPTGTIAE